MIRWNGADAQHRVLSLIFEPRNTWITKSVIHSIRSQLSPVKNRPSKVIVLASMEKGIGNTFLAHDDLSLLSLEMMRLNGA